MKNFICFAITFIAVFSSKAQMYTPIDTANYELRVAESKIYAVQVKEYYSVAKRRYKLGELKLFKERCENVNKLMTEFILTGQYVLNSKFQQLLDSIQHEILKSNPNLPTDLKFYLSRDNTLNASSLGNKYFSVNMGCFYFSENEDQLAAIICHEIAHYQLDHVLGDIQNQYSQKKMLDVKEEIYNIKNSSGNWGDKAYNRLKELLYTEGKRNKQQEFEADSMGYILFKNTQFNKREYINSFINKELYDTIRPIGLKLDTYKRTFDLSTLPFKESWLKKEDFSKYDYTKFKEKFNEDSLSSHPETESRIKALIKIFPELGVSADVKAPSESYKQLTKISVYEQPCNFASQEEYGLGVYFCLFRIQNDENTEYYKVQLGNFFQKIYEARKVYKLNRYVDRLDPKNQSESYQQFLSFIWNLNLSEIKTIAEYYSKKAV